MPSFAVETAQRTYGAIVERGVIARAGEHVPAKVSKLFVITTRDVWELHGERLRSGLAGRDFQTLFFTGGEERKRLAEVEVLAGEMAESGGDRAGLVIAFGGGIVNDVAGFVASIFMRGIPVIQIPTTLLAQVDAAIGGKTGVNLVCGKNLVGTFHQPGAVLIDPEVLGTLPEREYRAGLYEVLKCGVIRSRPLFDRMAGQSGSVLARQPAVLDEIIAESVRIKAEVVSADEREGDLRRILNFGHTIGHALEAETGYTRFLHGEAVAFGMRAATHLAHLSGVLAADDAVDIVEAIELYGPIPPLDGMSAQALAARLRLDKKTLHGAVHFVVPEEIGRVKIVSGVNEKTVLMAIDAALR